MRRSGTTSIPIWPGRCAIAKTRAGTNACDNLPRRGAGADERDGLENRWPLHRGPWVRIPPPPLDQAESRFQPARSFRAASYLETGGGGDDVKKREPAFALTSAVPGSFTGAASPSSPPG